MSTPSLNEMCKVLKKQYPNRVWAAKVNNMPVTQVLAIYRRLMEKGSLHSVAQRKSEELFGPPVSATQIHLF